MREGESSREAVHRLTQFDLTVLLVIIYMYVCMYVYMLLEL